MPESVRERLSRYLDGEVSADEATRIEQLIDESPEAGAYVESLRELRRQLRYESVESTPDVTGPVLVAVAADRRHTVRPRLVAGFAAGLIAGAVFIGLSLQRPASIAAADIPERVLDAQTGVSSLTAELNITERGWHPEVPERTYRGRIDYVAPESVLLEIDDLTRYPSEQWTPNDVTMVVAEDLSWSSSVSGCPTWALPDCLPEAPRSQGVFQREPFPDASPAPLDLIVPVQGFSRADTPELIGVDEIDGRRAIGVRVTAAQVDALLNGLTAAGNWREIHPTDTVELWLDRDALVPLALSVMASDGEDRVLWAGRKGYADDAGATIFEARWVGVRIDEISEIDLPDRPSGLVPASAGFQPGTVADDAMISSLGLPEGMTPHRQGVVQSGGPAVFVATWTDGRAWLKLSWTSDWGADRLFGDVGPIVRVIAVGGGVGYVSELGDRIAIHGDGVDLVFTGSVTTGELARVAGDIGVTGVPVPVSWEESATATVDEARSVIPNLLLPMNISGFGPPSVRILGDSVVISYAGAGNRGFLLTESAGAELSPPLEAKVRGVRLRGVDARYSPERGVLDWVEGDLTITLESRSLSLDEILGLGESLDTG